MLYKDTYLRHARKMSRVEESESIYLNHEQQQVSILLIEIYLIGM